MKRAFGLLFLPLVGWFLVGVPTGKTVASRLCRTARSSTSPPTARSTTRSL